MKKKSQKKKNSLKKCSICYGYGLWRIGQPVPMGRMDAEDGIPTRKCPECGANYNDYEILNKKKK